MYTPDPYRYDGRMAYRRAGRSGLLLPAISLGLWQNFGEDSSPEHCEILIRYAFDNGITSFDLANNYGPPPGAAEALMGRVLRQSLRPYRDELFITTKAGHDMWPGPYGSWNSRKHLLSSLDQSLRRLGVDYVDAFYSHRYDPSTPLEETVGALADAVRQGKALYVGLSKYPADVAARAYDALEELGVHCLLYQGRYNLYCRAPELDVLPQAAARGVGFVAFSPLAQGLLTDRYLHGIPAGSRATHSPFLRPEQLTKEVLERTAQLDALARGRGQTLASMALSWLLRDARVTSVIVGASSTRQLGENLEALYHTDFDEETLRRIDEIAAPPAQP